MPNQPSGAPASVPPLPSAPTSFAQCRACVTTQLSFHELLETSPIAACLRCGRLCIKVADSFVIRSIGGPPVTVHVCYRCGRAGLGRCELRTTCAPRRQQLAAEEGRLR